MDFLNSNRTIASYETYGGEHGFVRYGRETIRAELEGFSSAVTETFISEAVFVAAENASLVRFVLSTRFEGGTIAALLVDCGIPFRYPAGSRPAPVVDISAITTFDEYDDDVIDIDMFRPAASVERVAG